MPFADYFGSWLFGLVADRATRWFTNALIGDEVDRAVRQAALAAAGRAAQELLPDDVLDRDRAAGLLIEAIDDAFAGGPDNGAAEPSAATLLEAVNSGIAARESGESFGEAGVLNQLGRLEVEQARDTPMPAPDQERARTYLTTALDLYASVKSDVGQAEVLTTWPG